MLSATSQSRNAARFLRLAMASIMDILKIKPFVEVSVGQLLWGYEDPLLKLAKDVVPKEQKLPYDQFGLMYRKNGTQPDLYTVFTGRGDVTKYGMLERWNGKKGLGHWSTPHCDSVSGTDGSIFPPHITKHTILRVFDKDLCRALPLVFKVRKRDIVESTVASAFFNSGMQEYFFPLFLIIVFSKKLRQPVASRAIGLCPQQTSLHHRTEYRLSSVSVQQDLHALLREPSTLHSANTSLRFF